MSEVSLNSTNHLPSLSSSNFPVLNTLFKSLPETLPNLLPDSLSESLQKYLNSLPEWQDPSRIRGLFAKFPNRETRPAAYDSQLRFWKGVLHGAMSSRLLNGNDFLGLEVDNLNMSFVHGENDKVLSSSSGSQPSISSQRSIESLSSPKGLEGSKTLERNRRRNVTYPTDLNPLLVKTPFPQPFLALT